MKAPKIGPAAFDFVWPVAHQGYRAVSVTTTSQTHGVLRSFDDDNEIDACTELLVITKGASVKGLFGERRGRPLAEDPELFRTFANLSGTPEAVCRFAGSHGLLGGSLTTAIAEGQTLRGQDAEPICLWKREIDTLRRAVSTWEAIRVRGSRKLARYHESLPPDDADSLDHRVLRHQLGDINRKLENAVKAGRDEGARRDHVVALSYQLNRYLDQLVRPVLSWQATPSKFRLDFLPTSLLGAIWLQFALAVGRASETRQCARAGCGGWFEVSAGSGKRRSRKYCCDACKLKVQRARESEARQLNRRGLPPLQIAKRLGTTAKTVRGWLKGRKARTSSSLSQHVV